jgi:hypothetical protein
MRANAFVAALIWPMLVASVPSRADERGDVAQLDQLMAQIKPMLPAGWSVKFEISNSLFQYKPQLQISSQEKLPIYYLGMAGRPSSVGDRPPEPDAIQEVKMDFALMPYMSPQEYELVRTRNEALERKRREFEVSRLGIEQSNFKGGVTPASFEWQTRTTTPFLREYAILWLNTEPQPLPTHYYGSLSFRTTALGRFEDFDIPELKIFNAEKNQEYLQIVGGLRKLLSSYHKPRQAK